VASIESDLALNSGKSESNDKVKQLTSSAKQVLKEPILKKLQEGSVLSEAQIETLLIDLVVEDSYGSHITYEDKASYRSKEGTKSRGVSRGAFNRTLNQSRRNLTRCFYTMLLLAYLGLFEFTIFRPFEEVAARIGDYRRIRDILAGKKELTTEELESIRVTERTIMSAVDELSASLTLKSEISKRKSE
jgi:predicted DNA-binding protein (UPF0251 family)